MEQRLDIQTVKIKLIIEDYRSGRLVIPEFQREYVWKKSRAPHLIDSIYRSFPISALLLWSSDADVRSRRRDPKPVRGNSISWLIDGQQRFITLSRILSGDEGIELYSIPMKMLSDLLMLRQPRTITGCPLVRFWTTSVIGS
jgi:hypothetical protein